MNKKLIRNYAISLIVVIVFVILLFLFPKNKSSIMDNSLNYFIEMMFILPGVMIIMGLFSVWISKEKITKYIGKNSGLKGSLIAIFIGSLPTGPLYIAFPVAGLMIKKGASISNIVVFLSAWACLKIPQGLVELQFLGWKFLFLRWIFSIIFILMMGAGIEKMIDKKSIKNLQN